MQKNGVIHDTAVKQELVGLRRHVDIAHDRFDKSIKEVKVAVEKNGELAVEIQIEQGKDKEKYTMLERRLTWVVGGVTSIVVMAFTGLLSVIWHLVNNG